MIFELHCHTSEYSACSHVNAVELIKRAFHLGLQGIVITDHHYQWNQDDLAKIKNEAGLPDIFRVMAGQEYKSADFGDVLIYGLEETIKKEPIPLSEIRKRFPEAAIIWAHPYRHNKVPSEEKLLSPLIDGVEIFSSNYTVAEAARGLKGWHQLKFTAIAGTDTHALSYTGSYPTIFDHPVTSIKELVTEIKMGRCRPYFREVPRAGTTNTTITELTIGPDESKSKNKVIVKVFEDVDSWRDGERSHHLVEEILRHGFAEGKYRISRPLDKDENNLSLIEETISGDTLFDKLIKADKAGAQKYLRMTAGWLAELHNMELKITPENEYANIEKERLDHYLSGMYEDNHPNTARAQQVLDEVWKNEKEILLSSENLVQVHGDFHPKNIFIGKDEETGEEFAGAIDFNSSFLLPKAFDVGSFLAQYRNMFFDNYDVIRKAPVEIFLEEYMKRSVNPPADFEAMVQLYKARTFISVIYYLVKVGKGETENFWTILVEAERSLAHMSVLKSMAK